MTTDTQIQELQAHPFAAMFPLMDGADFDRLVADIKENGLREAITTLDGKILDGRNRYRACLEAGVEPRTEEWDGQGDPLAYVVSKNLNRRHMSESPRAMVAARIAEQLKQPDSPGDGSDDIASAYMRSPSGKKTEAAAKMVNVGPRLVEHAVHVLSDGAPGLAEMVDCGSVPATVASRLARLPVDAQREAIAGGPSAVKKAAPLKRKAQQHSAPSTNQVGNSAPRTEDLPEADTPDPDPDDLQPQPTYACVLIDDREPPTGEESPAQDMLPVIDSDAGQVWIRFRPEGIGRAMRIADMCQTRPLTLFTAIRTDTTPAQVVEHALVAVRGSPTFGDDLANLPKVTVLPTDDTYPFERLMESCAGVPRHRIDLRTPSQLEREAAAKQATAKS